MRIQSCWVWVAGRIPGIWVSVTGPRHWLGRDLGFPVSDSVKVLVVHHLPCSTQHFVERVVGTRRNRHLRRSSTTPGSQICMYTIHRHMGHTPMSRFEGNIERTRRTSGISPCPRGGELAAAEVCSGVDSS